MEEIQELLTRDFRSGLETLCNEYALEFLLIFMDYGVLWGRMIDGSLLLSIDQNKIGELNTPDQLALEVFQQGYCFSPALELCLWKSQNTLQISWIESSRVKDKNEKIEEMYCLWGTVNGPQTKQGFLHLSESGRGINQYVPAPVEASKNRNRLGLSVTHFLEEDKDNGQYYIETSKLNTIDWMEG